MRQPELKTAKEISEHLLNVTANALMQHDFESFASAFGLPQTMTTAESEIRLLTRDDLRTAFEQMCECFQSMGVTELRRVCEAAAFCGPDRVEATHTSYVLAHGNDVVPPYPVFSVLERLQGQWKITSSDYALAADQPQAQALDPHRMSNKRALLIYQDHLDRTTASLMAGDFAAFRETIELPHTMQTETGTQLVTTTDDMERTFYLFAEKYRDTGMTDFFRIAKEAYFHTEDDIRGVHESHLIRHGTRLIPPYPNRVRLKRCADGQWRETHSTNAIRNGEGRFHLWAEVAEKPTLPDLVIDPERTPND
ncbi:hypothetical protein SLH49_09420 [Cognatiyoonia sp. IB215446]|uniref:hypothetical protein n=1 Tax=Cognatiyoonia sp. IB215446 TaxID=3097355 RepID=UPI002A0BADA7|nr:hypothetical protein [Cognatiyoonia sp. IB215446]MDX8348206.1 hypothetical protein [Cognatiyoonia sp. IB215446]